MAFEYAAEKPAVVHHAVADRAWEQYTMSLLEMHAEVAKSAKSDHFGFPIYYPLRGSKRRFVPDFLIRLANGKLLVLEIKGEDSDQNRNKRMALDTWVRAVNSRGGFGTWCWDVVKGEPSKVADVIVHHARHALHSEPIGEGVLIPEPNKPTAVDASSPDHEGWLE